MIFASAGRYGQRKGLFRAMHLPSCLTCGTVGGALAHQRHRYSCPPSTARWTTCACLMEVVLPNGDIINTLPVPKHAAGPDLNHILHRLRGYAGRHDQGHVQARRAAREPHPPCVPVPRHACRAIMAGRDIMQKVKPSIVRLFDEAETVSIIKKIIGFEKKGCFMNLTLEGYEKVVAAELEIVLDIAQEVRRGGSGQRNTAKSGSRTALPSSIPTISWICPRCSARWIPWRPTTILRRSTGR